MDSGNSRSIEPDGHSINLKGKLYNILKLTNLYPLLCAEIKNSIFASPLNLNFY